jgi:hypothetical protein
VRDYEREEGALSVLFDGEYPPRTVAAADPMLRMAKPGEDEPSLAPEEARDLPGRMRRKYGLS